MKIWQAGVAADAPGKTGEIVATGRDGIVVVCGSGTLLLETVQQPDGKILNEADIPSGPALQPCSCFDFPA